MWNSSDLVLPPIGTTPVATPWNITLIAVYLPAILFLYIFTAARKAYNFSEGGWAALFVVRCVEGIVGLLIPLAVSNSNSGTLVEWLLGLSCSLLHDLGTFCVVISLTRALFHALDLWDNTFLNILRRLWGFVMVLLPIPGYFFAGVVVSFMYSGDHDLQSYDSKRVNGYSVIAYSILQANIISLGATLLSMTPFFLFVFIKRRNGQLWASSTASATAIIFFPTLILMIVYLVNDMLRFIANHIPTITQHFALSLAPEVLVTAMWLALARHIGKCDKEFVSHQRVMRELTEEKWNNEIDKAFNAHAGGEKLPMEKCESAEQKVEGVYECAMYRLERLHQDYMEDGEIATRNFVEEARLLVEDAKENARLIASCLVLAPCENCPLFGRQLFPSRGAQIGRPPFSAEKTGKLVLEAMKKDKAMKILNREQLKWAVSDIVRIHLSNWSTPHPNHQNDDVSQQLDLLTNTRNWSTPRPNHQNYGVSQQLDLSVNTTIEIL